MKTMYGCIRFLLPSLSIGKALKTSLSETLRYGLSMPLLIMPMFLNVLSSILGTFEVVGGGAWKVLKASTFTTTRLCVTSKPVCLGVKTMGKDVDIQTTAFWFDTTSLNWSKILNCKSSTLCSCKKQIIVTYSQEMFLNNTALLKLMFKLLIVYFLLKVNCLCQILCTNNFKNKEKKENRI